MKKVILCQGDSWTAGDDNKFGTTWPDGIVPATAGTTWPNVLEEEFKDVKVLNLAHPGSSNDAIVRRTLREVTELLKEYEPKEIFVIVGWSSPERRDFYFKNENYQAWETMYPAELDLGLVKYSKRKPLRDFYKLYFEYFWNEEEYLNRYVQHNLLIHNFLKNKNIEHLFFDAFYEFKVTKKNQGLSMLLNTELHNTLKEVNLYNEIKDIIDNHFMKTSFRRFLFDSSSKIKGKIDVELWGDHHPSKKAHRMWGKKIKEVIYDSIRK